MKLRQLTYLLIVLGFIVLISHCAPVHHYTNKFSPNAEHGCVDQMGSPGRVWSSETRRLSKQINASLSSGRSRGSCFEDGGVSLLSRPKFLLQLQGPGSLSVPRNVPDDCTSVRGRRVEGFVSGNLLNCVRIFPYSAVQFAVFEKCKEVMMDHKPPWPRSSGV